MPELTPSLDLLVLLLILALGLTFDFINGFHDTANAIATVVATRVLSPGRAVLMLNLFANAFPAAVTRIFGRAQLLSAAWMAFSHGSNDAQKTMGVMTMAVASYLHWGGSNWQVPLWIIIGAALAMGLGTSIGGWRIIRTMGLRVVQLRPIHGFAAETAAATVIEAASRLGIPVSTTHTISSAILGVGSTRRLSAVRWGVAGQIVTAWVFTIPACFMLAWLFRSLLGLLGV